jgi:hypothetical protein
MLVAYCSHSFWSTLNTPPLFGDSIRSQTISPLHIQLQHSEIFGNVQAIITNRGTTTAYFSTWRNPLSTDENARKLDVITVKDEFVQFVKAEGFVNTETIPEDYERLAAGNSITREINIAANYDIQSEEEYFILGRGSVQYHLEGQSLETILSATYETNILPFTAPKTGPLRYANGVQVPTASNYIFQSCADQVLSDKLNKSIPIAATVAKKAAENTAGGKSKEAFVAYFKTDSTENRKKVADRFTAMYKTLMDGKGPTKIGCRAKCQGYYAVGAAWTEPTTGKTEFCPAMGSKTYDEDVKRCNRANFPGVIIHELSHSSVLYRPSTGDRAGSPQQCKALLEAQALTNADNFNLYAQSVYLDTVC